MAAGWTARESWSLFKIGQFWGRSVASVLKPRCLFLPRVEQVLGEFRFDDGQLLRSEIEHVLIERVDEGAHVAGLGVVRISIEQKLECKGTDF